MITKEEYSKYADSLTTNIKSQSPEDLSKIGLQLFQFLLKNYSNLDAEMKVLTDKIMDECKKAPFEDILKKAPDNVETRKARRLFRVIKHELPSASGLVLALESKSIILEPVILETKRLFEEHFQHFLDYLYEVSYEDSHSGHPSFAKLSMLFSIVDELLAAFHMAQHAYINQAYSHIRTVFESINLIELFIQDETYAELWFSSNEQAKKKKLTPVAVRIALGIKEDPLYKFFSVHGTHVTKYYVQSRSSMSKKLSNKGNPQIRFSIGGTRDIPHQLWANVGCVLALAVALIQLGKSFPTRVHNQDFQNMIITFTKDFIEYLNSYVRFLQDAGINIEEIKIYLDNIKQSLNEANPN